MEEESDSRVSIIIPARNEETHIARAVRSVAVEDGVREILVVDDQSEDRTGQILENLKGEIPALRVLRIDALPVGWLGKTHAAAAAARVATSAWLLFTDADTEHLPGSLSELVRRAEVAHADLLSISPGQETPSWWERSVIPLVYVQLAKLYPFEKVSDPQSPLAAANGQYLLVRREVYERVGGHEAVREEILEDVALARRVKEAGGRLLFLPGARWARTRMYRTYSDMWEGWTKNLYLLYGRKLGCMFGAWIRLVCFDLAPPIAFIALSVVLVFGHGGPATTITAVGCFLWSLLRQWNYSQTLRDLGFDPRLANYQIPGAGLLALLLVNSVRAHRLARRIQWKGRTYSTRESR